MGRVSEIKDLRANCWNSARVPSNFFPYFYYMGLLKLV
jgi:hypothetical protein